MSPFLFILEVAMKRRLYFGFLPDLPDIRDFTHETEEVSGLLYKVGYRESSRLPSSHTLSNFPPIEDQGNLGSCTAQAAAALLEYYERKTLGRHIDVSRLFLYKVARNLLQLQGDSGASIRAVMGALVMFGAPPEKYWPYDIEKFDEEPPAFCYSFAENFKAIRYFRLDKNCDKEELLIRIKRFILKGIPSMFGFMVYQSAIEQAYEEGKIPFPSYKDRLLGGHAVVCQGYDDNMVITNLYDNNTTVGAFMIRNSWGTEWGANGTGWLPYRYVTEGLAIDWWSLISSRWVDTGRFT